MKSKTYLNHPFKLGRGLMHWPLLCGLLLLPFAGKTEAADGLYQNDAVITYPGTVMYPPVVDATNFVNTGTFLINFTDPNLTAGYIQPFYETSDTLNYTNTGLMMVNSGFRFDLQFPTNAISGVIAQTNRLPAANFYNQGTVSCSSTNNTTDPYFGLLGSYLGYAQCFVNATNVVNPGDIVAGVDGLIQLKGHSINMENGSLRIEGNNTGANVFGAGDFGLNTNFWNPYFDLYAIAPEALSSPPRQLLLTNASAYIFPYPGVSNNIYNVVFLQDAPNANITHNVYLGNSQRYAYIEWIGQYQDAATGEFRKNYFYLADDYILGASTNVMLQANGIPDNFYFYASPTKLGLGTPTPKGLSNIFPNEGITNLYSYASIDLTSVTAPTNSISNYSITNLPGRVELLADQDLNLSNSVITGPNYLSVQAPQQFDGSAGARIEAPYADINVGATNGLLTVSNLFTPVLLNWNGNIRAWTTRWQSVDATGVTNDFHVLIVGSQLQPTTLAQVQDLFLHGTNSIVLSDSMNVMRNFSADAQNLTITTNGFGQGATSLAGGLNLETSGIFWSSALPNLRNLTNNGAIQTLNLAQFMGCSNNIAVKNSVAAVAAGGTLSEVSAANVVNGSTVTIFTNNYVFVSQLTNSLPNQVMIASTLDGSLSNLVAAINSGSGPSSAYSSNTLANPLVQAGAMASTGSLTNHGFVVSARTAGTNGNLIKIATTSASLTWNGFTKLTGGAEAVVGSTNIVSTTNYPYGNFVNRGLLVDEGAVLWANNFESSGIISNQISSISTGSFIATNVTTTLTNGTLVAGGDIVITTGSLVTSNVLLQAGLSLQLNVSGTLSDTCLTNGNIWTVQAANSTGGNGLMMLTKPHAGDLLGTTITNFAPAPNRQTLNYWAGADYGVSSAGFANNGAIGHLVLDAVGPNSQFRFYGVGATNAIYVDLLEFKDAMTNGINNSFDFGQNLFINSNITIYFSQAIANGVSIAEKIDDASKVGRNNGRLRWVPSYAGFNSSVTQVDLSENDGVTTATTNTYNAALANSSTIDSNGDGIANGKNSPNPTFFTSAQVNLQPAVTNSTPPGFAITWNSIPGSTNTVYYTTNMASGAWMTLTNFVSPSVVPPVNGWPITNRVFDLMNPTQNRSYKVEVMPNSAMMYGE